MGCQNLGGGAVSFGDSNLVIEGCEEFNPSFDDELANLILPETNEVKIQYLELPTQEDSDDSTNEEVIEIISVVGLKMEYVCFDYNLFFVTK